jgi:pimeloyl-ACP methyl ester carboxylesterase
MKSQKVDREAARLLLERFEDVDLDWLQCFTMPTLVVCGTEDRDNGDPQELVEAVPNATLAEVPGTHMSSVTKPEFGEAIASFLAE